MAALTALGLCAGFANASLPGRVTARGHRPKLSVTPRALAHVGALAPGDRAERTLELRYRGAGRFAAVVLQMRSENDSVLNSATGPGLRLTMERCSKRWTREGRTKAFVCNGKHWSVLKAIRVTVKRGFTLRHLSRLPGKTDHLRLTVSLPRTAGNELQGRMSRMLYRFTGVAATR
ncbi:MAG TPA: hypothetical protein VHQ98_00695 [Gaiellaceae bacterium]|nr:hypothetical protein [Gaiellaceae bacterium]